MKFYTCPMCCNSGFTNQQDLKEHLLKASNPINCPACLKSCKNVLYLIKHLDQCAASKPEDEQLSYTRGNNSLNNLKTDPLLNDDDDDDDVEGYFCTVCDIKIPDVYKHIQQFHTGQEVILQDDDDDEGETLDPSHFFNSDNKNNSELSGLSNKREYKKEENDDLNGDNTSEESHRSKKMKKKYKNDEDVGEALYCIKCDISFLSLADHMKTYHNDFDVILKDVSITELFPESQSSNGSLLYNCTSCRKSFVRKTTLVKHLKLNVYKDAKSKQKNCCRKKSSEKLKKYETNYSSANSLESSYANEQESLEVKAEPEEEDYESKTGLEGESFVELDDLTDGIFRT